MWGGCPFKHRYLGYLVACPLGLLAKKEVLCSASIFGFLCGSENVMYMNFVIAQFLAFSLFQIFDQSYWSASVVTWISDCSVFGLSFVEIRHNL